MKKGFVVLALAVLIAAPLFAEGATESKFPTKSISIVCQANPGGSSDLNCRTIAPGMEEILGVPVTVENRPGAGGGIGISYAAAAPADGYVIGHLPVDVAQIKPAGNADVTPEDFRVLARVSTHPAAIIVKADSPIKTTEDFIAYAKSNPGKVSVGNSGTGAVWHLAACQFEQAADITLNHIPFEGAAPSITALMGGHIDAICASAAEVRAQIQSGDLRIVCVLSAERFGLFPDVPTAKEAGYDINVLCWLGFGVPAGTPDDVYNTILDAMRTSYQSEAYQNMLAANGYTPAWLEGEEFQKYAMEEFEIYNELIPRVLGY
ncbi:MAG: tripartite tricarboxylate transporter substrate binding protein [Spirochaetales bacterium]|nr:tripartite tricarboxylate transporter substrate binding protein [Spirochaetales bacterium]